MRITKYLSQALALTTLLGTASCGSDTPEGGNGQAEAAVQQFTVVVESVGELYTQASADSQSRRPISSVSPIQTIDKLALIIVEEGNSPSVVYRTTISGWSDTDNLVSTPWNQGNSQGRKAVLQLEGEECLPDGEYVVYAIGYQSGTYGGYEPFRNVEVGDVYRKTEVADVPLGEYADEIFSGAEIFHVHDGKIFYQASSESEEEEGKVVLRRQVAGTFGFFTKIPVTVEGESVARVRLVATHRNQSVIFGGFRDVDDPENFNKENVINGANPRADYDCRLAGSEKDNAFLVYEVELCKWFPGNSANAGLPWDANGDGILDEGDSNWCINEDKYPEGTISLPAGSVFGDCFWIASAVTEADVERAVPTFQMQLLNEKGDIVKYWDVLLRDLEDEEALQTRTIVSLPEGGGRAVITLEDNPETEYSYSIVRNRLYTMGNKAYGQSYGEDEPINLEEAEVLVMDSRHEWQSGGFIIFQ